MTDSFLFNRKTKRLQNWNYSWKSLYFVTVNTKLGKHDFGEITNNNICLSAIGKEVENQWLLTPSIRPDMRIELDEFIIMPNHFHGIIGIGMNEFNQSEILQCRADTSKMIFTEKKKRTGTFGPQRKNLGSIMRGFKSSVTTWCRKNHIPFDWHQRYHDWIIRDETMLNNIRNYIINNPTNWHQDRFYK